MSVPDAALFKPLRDDSVSSQTATWQVKRKPSPAVHISEVKKKPLPALHISEVESEALDTAKSPPSVVSADEEAQPILPEPVEGPVASALSSPRYAKLRWGLFTIYRRLFSVVFIANIVAFIVVIRRDRLLTDFVNAAAANLLGVGLARQPLVVNVLFRIFCSLPRTAPLRLRRLAAKIFHYGGVHSGCGVASFVWYAGFIGLLSREAATGASPTIATPAILIIAYVILFLLLAIITAAYPGLRFKNHDVFEFTHRFSGWLAVALFWPLLLLFAHATHTLTHRSMGHVLATLPAFWILIILTCAIIHPWLYLRRLPVTPEPLSSHAIRLHFSGTTRFGQGFAVSKHPLRDWHGFAQFPDLDGRGFSILVSKAGDWTSDAIANPPTHLWKRGIPFFGFGYTIRMFNSFVIVTTGSGIGPCLSTMGLKNRPRMRVVWQTKSPMKTYGQGILDCVHNLDKDPIVIDSSKSGKRKDMLPLVLELVKSFNAEAVLVVSNPVFTRNMVFELEARGIPAYGPLFDS